MANAPKRPRTKAGKPKVETPKRKRVRKPVDADKQNMDKALAIAKDTADSMKAVSKSLRDELPTDPYEAYRAETAEEAANRLRDGMQNACKVDSVGKTTPIEWNINYVIEGEEQATDKSLADSVILVALGIVSGAIATAACFLIFA